MRSSKAAWFIFIVKGEGLKTRGCVIARNKSLCIAVNMANCVAAIKLPQFTSNISFYDYEALDNGQRSNPKVMPKNEKHVMSVAS